MYSVSRREFFAAMAMQGIEASNFENGQQLMESDVREIAKRAVSMADALIAELDGKNYQEKGIEHDLQN